MDNSVFTPEQVLEKIMQAGEKRILLPVLRCILLGIMAGGFIAFGGATSSVAAHQISNVGIARLVTAVVFPVGLMMIVMVGGELFTGDCLMVTGLWDKRYGIGKMIRVLAVVWISNLIGSVLIAALVSGSGIFDYSAGGMGAFVIKTAYGKCTMGPMRAFISGILCNILVCAAVLISTAAKDAVGKLMGVFFPIMAFVVAGWEHSVANMFYLPAGIFAAHHSAYVQKGTVWPDYTADSAACESVRIFWKYSSRYTGQYRGGNGMYGTSTVSGEKGQAVKVCLFLSEYVTMQKNEKEGEKDVSVT